ncbi:MAG TPA: class I SAM-dependent methyltransferase [Candidatus Paceibacterota bacterium]
MEIKPKMQFINATRELINQSQQPESVTISSVRITTHPDVFNPSTFFSSKWFADQLSHLIHKESIFIEVGSGTGIVSIKCALSNPKLQIYATDISQKAAELTRANATKNGVSGRVVSYSGNVLDALPERIKADSIFWAMPFGYVEPNYTLVGREAQVFDPGYVAIRKFFTDAVKYLKKKGRLIIGFSSDIGHYELLEKFATENGYSLKLLKRITGQEKSNVSMELHEARLINNSLY